MPTHFAPHADSDHGVAATVATINTLATHYGRLPCIRAAALAIVGDVADDDQAAQLAQLAAFVRQAVRFVRDPQDAELIHTPDVLLLAIYENGRVAGDCDDHCILFQSLALAVGLPCETIAVSSPGAARLDHVIVCAYPDAGPVEFDLTQK